MTPHSRLTDWLPGWLATVLTPAQREPSHDGPVAEIVFWVGVAVFVLVQSLTFSRIYLVGETPFQIDDILSYLVIAGEVESCFLQDCPAMEALEAQITQPADDHTVANMQWRVFQRTFVMYNLLHAASLAALHGLGLPWLAAFKVVAAAGALLIIGGCAYLLRSLWGPGAAGLGLMIIATFIFRRQGLHYIVPNNIALGIALVLWAVILHRRRFSPVGFAIGMVALLTMHTVGLVYGIITLVLLWAITERPIPRYTWITLAAGTVLIIGWAALTTFLQKPVLSGFPQPAPPDWTYSQYIIDSVEASSILVQEWATSLGGALVVLGLVVFGVWKGSRWQLQVLSVFGVLFAGVLILTPFYDDLPGYAAVLFSRLWIGPVVLLSGLIGFAIQAAVRDATSMLNTHAPGKQWLMIGVVLLAAGYMISVRARVVATQYEQVSRTRAGTQHLALSDAELAPIREAGDPCRVAYDTESGMYFALIHGLFGCEAVFLPALEDPAVIDDNPPDFVYLQHPVSGIPRQYLAGPGLVRIPEEPFTLCISVRLPEVPIQLHVENNGPATTLTASAPQGEMFPVRVDAGWQGWLTMDALDDAMCLHSPGGLVLSGFKTESPGYWEWEQGATLAVGGGEHTILINADEILEGVDLTILDDYGAMIVGQVEQP